MEEEWPNKTSNGQTGQKPLCAPALFKKYFHREALEHYAMKGLKFEVDTANKGFLGHFCRYWNQDPQFEIVEGISLRKGLFVFGGYGTGKTSSFKIIREISKRYGVKELWFPSIPAQEVVSKYNCSRNKEEVIAYYSKGEFLFDDLGSETVGNNVYQYGKEDIFIRILLARYRNFEDNGIKTHITTNLNLSQIGDRYRKQISDRFVRMFNQLRLDGPSRRK